MFDFLIGFVLSEKLRIKKFKVFLEHENIIILSYVPSVSTRKCFAQIEEIKRKAESFFNIIVILPTILC